MHRSAQYSTATIAYTSWQDKNLIEVTEKTIGYSEKGLRALTCYVAASLKEQALGGPDTGAKVRYTLPGLILVRGKTTVGCIFGQEAISSQQSVSMRKLYVVTSEIKIKKTAELNN